MHIFSQAIIAILNQQTLEIIDLQRLLMDLLAGGGYRTWFEAIRIGPEAIVLISDDIVAVFPTCLAAADNRERFNDALCLLKAHNRLAAAHYYFVNLFSFIEYAEFAMIEPDSIERLTDYLKTRCRTSSG